MKVQEAMTGFPFLGRVLTDPWSTWRYRQGYWEVWDESQEEWTRVASSPTDVIPVPSATTVKGQEKTR